MDTTMSNVKDEFFPDAGCRYFKGFCVMCPFEKCLLAEVTPRQRAFIVRLYCLKILVAKGCTPSVMQIAMNLTSRQLRYALRKVI